MALHGGVRARPLRKRQGAQRDFGDGSEPRCRPRRRGVLPPGLRRAARQARRGHSGVARHRGEARGHHRPRHQGGGVDHEGHCHRPPHHHHRVNQRDTGPHEVRRRPAQALPGRARKAQARQLRPHRAGAQGQSARPAARRSGDREIVGAAHRRSACQCRRHAAYGGRGRRQIWPRPRRAGRQGDDRVCRGIAERYVWRRREEGAAAHAGDAVEEGSLGARRIRVGVAGRPGSASHSDGADPEPRVLRRRGGARDHLRHRGRRLGFRHARGRGGDPPYYGSA